MKIDELYKMFFLLIKKINHHIIIFSYLFIILFSFQFGFAQQKKAPSDIPHFVYQSSLSCGYGIGNNFVENDTLLNRNFSFEIQQILAYQLNNYFFTGVGAGLDFWFCEKKTSTFIPIFANATVKFMDKKSAPFLYANVGYAFKWQVEKRSEENIFYGTKAGICFQTGVGLNMKFSEKFSLLLSAYYKLQQSAIQYRDNLLLVETENQLFHFVGIKLGFLY